MIKKYIHRLLFAFIIFNFVGISNADQKSSKKLYTENKKLAEENPGSFIEKAYAGVNVVWNRQNQYEVVFVYKDSPADKAGIRPGDIVLSLDSVPIKNRYQAFKIYDGKYPGDVMTVKLKRRGKVFVKKVKLESHHILYLYYVIQELINKDIPIRLAFFVHDIKSENMNEQEMEKWKSLIISQWVGSLESIFIQNYRGQNNFTIVDRTQTETVLKEFAFQKSGFVPSEFQSKLGILGATHLFIVNLSVMQSTNTLYYAMRLIEVESGKVIASASLISKLDGKGQQIKTKDASLKKQEGEAAAYAFGAARAKELWGIADATKLTPEQNRKIVLLGQEVLDWQVKNNLLHLSWEDAYKLMKQDEGLKRQMRAERLITNAPKHETERGTRFIRSLNAEISDIKFYEYRCKLLPIIPSFLNPFPKPPVGGRDYNRSFSKNAKCIFWEMKLNYPKPNQIIYYQIHWVHYRPNGTELFRTTSDSYVLENWTSSWLTNGIFMKDSILSYGEWNIGTHRVDFYVEGEKVASETFEIY